MKKKVKVCIAAMFALFFLVAISTVVYWAWKYYVLPEVKDLRGKGGIIIPAMPDRTQYESLEKRAVVALDFARKRNMSTRYALFVDYGVPSGTPRLYVWDFEKNCIEARTYVMHGPGKGSTAEHPVFSNEIGSNCSTLGRFLVTKEHGRRNKTGYKLKGLDIDNRNAYRRALMIHKSPYVDGMVWKKYIPLNPRCCQGCVTVTSKGMDYIGKLVKSEKKPILLWNYCSTSE